MIFSYSDIQLKTKAQKKGQQVVGLFLCYAINRNEPSRRADGAWGD